MSALVAILLLLVVNALEAVSAVSAVSAATGEQAVVEQPGVSAYVLGPDGTPVSGGTVVAQSGIVSTTASIDGTGRFRLVPMRAGSHQLLVTVPGLPAYRVTVTVPDSRSLRLPVIRLSAGVYFRVRLVSPTGEPIIAPQLRRRLFDVSGKPIVDRLGDRISDPADNDGAITIGPLPRGIMSVAVDTPLFAQTRLPDVNVGDATNNVDGGTIAIQQPGAVLHVDVLDETGAPVPDHDVFPRRRSSAIAAGTRARTNESAGTCDIRPAGHGTVPCVAGAYVIELHGAGGRRTERIRIVDRDGYATFR